MLSDSREQEIKDQLTAVRNYADTELFTRQNTWGPINFEQVRSDVESVWSDTTVLMSLPIKYLSESVARDLENAAHSVQDSMNEIDNFSIEAGDLAGQCDRISKALREKIDAFQTVVSPIMPYLAWRAGDFSKFTDKLDQIAQQAQDKFDETVNLLNDKSQEVEEIVEATRQAAAITGVATFTQEFGREVEQLKKRSFWWLFATVGFGILTLAAAITFFFWSPTEPVTNAWETLRIVASKATIIAVLFTGTVWCGRIFRALEHQATINRHRELSLKTFQAFVKATKDPNVKDAVLLTTTKAIFGFAPTGLINQPSNEEKDINVVEFGKSLASKMKNGDLE